MSRAILHCRSYRLFSTGLTCRLRVIYRFVRELEAGLHARGCSCPGSRPRWESCFADRPTPAEDPATRCTCAAGAAALAAMEACVAAGTALAARGGGGGTKKALKRQRSDLVRLRAWRGLAALDQAAAAAAEEARSRKAAKQRGRKKKIRADRGHAIDALLGRLAEGSALRRPLLPTLCVPKAGGELDWGSVPAVLHPAFGKDSAREQRKRWQLESLFAVLQLAVGRLDVAAAAATAADPAGRLRVVDFGSGSGNSALA